MAELKIVLGPKRAVLKGLYPRDAVDEAISAKIEGAQFSPKFRQRNKDGSRVWDGKMHLLARATNSFPLGVLDVVTDALDKEGVAYDVIPQNLAELNLPVHLVNRWEKPWTVPLTAGPYTLWDHQKAAITRFFSIKGHLPYRGILRCPTSSGKTAIGATISKMIDAPTLFLVHGKNLKEQNLEVFRKVFHEEPDKVGIIDSKRWEPSQVTVASTDTLYSKMKNPAYARVIDNLFNDIVLVIADECHRATSKSFADIIRATNAPMRLGLSGTPLKKEDDRDLLLLSLTGPVIYSIGLPELQAKGKVSRAHLLCVSIDAPKIESLSYREAYDALIVNNDFRYNVIRHFAVDRIENDKSLLVLAGNSLLLAHTIYDKVKRSLKDKSQIAIVTGETSEEDAKEAFAALQDKSIRCIVTTVVTDEGIDIPEINCQIMAGGGKSFVKTIQRPGRGLRLKSDGGNLEVIEILDNTNHYLKKHALKRLQYYEEEGIFEDIDFIRGSSIFKETDEQRHSEVG